MLKTIMVVDDEEDNRSSIRTILESNGFKVVTANDGDDCLKKLKKVKPALILMDIMMPGTPVSVVVKEIVDIPIAYLTVVRGADDQVDALMKVHNVVDFIQKPFDVTKFVKRIKKLVSD